MGYILWQLEYLGTSNGVPIWGPAEMLGREEDLSLLLTMLTNVMPANNENGKWYEYRVTYQEISI